MSIFPNTAVPPHAVLLPYCIPQHLMLLLRGSQFQLLTHSFGS